MPYLPKDARNKSEYYQKILDSDIIEQQEIIADLKGKQQVSGSIDANVQLRNQDGHLMSVESPFQKGKSLEEDFQLIRIENRQDFFNDKNLNKIDREFTFFRPPVELDIDDDDLEKEEIREEIKREEKKQQPNLPLKKMFIRFVNRTLMVNYDVRNMNADLLHSKIAFIFKRELKPRTKLRLNFGFLSALNKNQRRGLPIPKTEPKNQLQDMVGSIAGLLRLKNYLDNSDYKSLYEQYVLPNTNLRKYWQEANENAPRAEFDMYNVSGLEGEEEFK